VSWPRRRRLPALGLAAVLLAGCASANSPNPSAATSQPTPSPTQTTAPTPSPNLILIGVDDAALSAALRQWAAGRGWGTMDTGPDELRSLADDPTLAPLAVVSFGQPVSSPAPTVLVEVEGATSSDRVSTVGTPGARYDQAGFLGGVLAGLASQTEWVGELYPAGASDDPIQGAYRDGFAQGVLLGCPKCRVVSLSSAEASVDGYRGQGVDIVFVVPSPETQAQAAALAQAGVWVVWSGPLPEALSAASSGLAGRVSFELQPLLLEALEALAGGAAGQAWPYSIQNGSLVLADLNSAAISPGRQRLLEEAYQAVASGDLALEIDMREGQ